ncbi:MAG: hypothetical protein HYS74_01690 [Parcubacteria group bacterium]|nr:hypothetical protein [Parcubacteria group bacterium]
MVVLYQCCKWSTIVFVLQVVIAALAWLATTDGDDIAFVAFAAVISLFPAATLFAFTIAFPAAIALLSAAIAFFIAFFIAAATFLIADPPFTALSIFGTTAAVVGVMVGIVRIIHEARANGETAPWWAYAVALAPAIGATAGWLLYLRFRNRAAAR